MHEGRVEVKHRRRWGTVCDDNWDLLDASVACRSLGYGSAALALHRSSYGQGVGKVSLVSCVRQQKQFSFGFWWISGRTIHRGGYYP